MKAVLTVARRELKALFDHPTGYILLVVFIALSDFLYFRTAFLVGIASLRPMLELLPWMFLFFVPAVTMRALAEDVRSGTIEVVLSQPLTELELLLGKFVGQVAFVWLALFLTLPIPLGLSLGADLQVGVIAAQYFGAAVLGAAFTAVGVWASSLARHQITAFIIGVAVMFLFILVGIPPVLMGLPPVLAEVAANLSIITHFGNIARGVIDLRDVVYFLSVAGMFLVFAYGALMGRKLSPAGSALGRLRLGTLLLAAALVVVNLFGRHIGGRLDLTPGKAYTLSPATRTVLADLPDLVTLRLFVSKELPPEVSVLKRDIDDLLGDMRSAGGGKVRLVSLDPDGDEQDKQAAEDLGIPAVQFNVARRSEFQVKEGYLGLAIEFAGENETIPLIQRTDDLEYRVVSAIRSMTRDRRPVVGFLELHPQNPQAPRPPGYQAFLARMRELYTVKNITLGTDSLSVAELDALVLADSPSFLDDSLQVEVLDYVTAGGNVLLMTGAMQVSQQPNTPVAIARPVVWNRVIEPFGVQVMGDMVYDLASNEAVSMRQQFGSVVMNYPFWLRALSTESSSINKEVRSIFLPWTSSIDTSAVVPGTVTPLYTTSRAGGIESEQALIAPQRQEFPQTDLKPQLVAALVNHAALEADTSGLGRLVVVANSDFLSDAWVQNAPQNLAFGLNVIDWLVQESALITIRAKDRTPPSLVFEREGVRDLVQYGNTIGIPLLVAIFALLRLWRRKRLTRQTYRPLAEAA